MTSNTDRLLYELDAREGTFLLTLRKELKWDHEKFKRLIESMLSYLADFDCEKEQLDKEIANGFWHVSTFVRDWSSHPSFQRMFSKEYYDLAYDIIWSVGYCYFSSESPHVDIAAIKESLVRLENLK